MLKIEMKPNHCNCHPETCCCFDYQVHVDGQKVAEGRDSQQIERLVLLAQAGAQALELRRLAKVQADPEEVLA